MSVNIVVEATQILSYAMAHNQVPIVNKLTLTNTGADLDAAELRIEVRDDEAAVSHPCVLTVDLPAGVEAVVPEVQFQLDAAAMLQVRDRRPARLVVSVKEGENEVGRVEIPVQLLPGSHWLSVPTGLAFELLPAFVLPNDPAVSTLLDEAASILERRTGSPSMEGYQAGADRVDQVASALWQATQDRLIRYALPPASWSEIGQKVRTPAEVLEGRVGTCLDTTVVLAAALEQSGIRPLIWVIEGHAFLAYWRDENALDGIVYADPDDVVNYVDIGVMRLVETTAVTASEQPVPFEATHRLALQHLQSPNRTLAIIDVWSARQSSVLPLPVRRLSDQGEVQVIHYQAAQHSARTVFVGGGETRQDGLPSSNAPARVQQWKNSLLDLSLRNRLINYTDRAGVRLRVPQDRLGEIEDLVSAGRALTLRASDQIEAIDLGRGVRSAWDLPDGRIGDQLTDKLSLYSDVTTAGYLSRMRNLAYKARTIQEETGANNLYLALGSLLWSLDGRPLRSPLMLVPVRLATSGRGQHYRLQLDDTGATTPNYCLLEKLRQTHGLVIPKLAEPEQDLSGVDLDHALQEARLAIAAKGLPFRVEPTADLSILQFAKFRLWKDLDEHWQTLTDNALVRHLVEHPTDPFDDPVEPPEAEVNLDALDAVCPVPADASQLSAIAEAVAGRTFVLEGPPGTGKSQTITNLLTRAVADGKRVLFVAEKRAALDVVSSRLDAVGMGAFSLDLHDKASKPTVVREQIRRALEHSVTIDREGLAVLEEDLVSSRKSLARYAERLHERNPAGHSFYSARTQLIALREDGETLTIPAPLLERADLLQSVRRELSALPDVADPANPRVDHPWGFVRLTTADPDTVTRIASAGSGVDQSIAELPVTGPLHDLIRAARTPEDLHTVAALAVSAVPLQVLDQTRTEAWRSSSSQLTAELAAFAAAAHPGLEVVTPDALNLPLADIHAQAQAAESSGFFGRSKRRKEVLSRLQPVLRQGVEVKSKKVLELTTALIQVQGAVSGLAQRVNGVPGVKLPDSWNPLTDAGQHLIRRQTEWLTWAGTVVNETNGQPEFTTAVRAWVASENATTNADGQALRTCAAAFADLASATAGKPDDFRSWSGSRGLVGQWSVTSAGRSTNNSDQLPLRRWIALQARLKPLRDAGMTAAADALAVGDVSADGAASAFDRGVCRASLDERRQTTGLESFDPMSHDRTVARFARSIEGLREQMATVVPAQVIESRPFQVSTARGQVGELQRELAKQRRGLGVRSLMQRYGSLITQVMPCVLVSPDSVARFFPVGSQTFDLVVFDEASQIRVADAIGAMGRARSVVVVGDSKQMPPTSFAEPASNSDDDDPVSTETVVEDEESILTEAVLARVPQRWLTWHYRSQDESLIAFSNAHYYDNRLSSFPTPARSDERLERGHGISLVRVNGTFQRKGVGKLLRTNPVEADAIVSDVRRRFAASPDATPSLGVVTFNQQQRSYIEGLLRDTQDERIIEALEGTLGEGLFVKNLENVQGDERDVILFSTAFSVNDKGVLPLNFGPLTRAGGERRLNVAITRARRQVVIYSSFDPAQLRTEQTQSVGIHHLRGYLELAATGAGVLTDGRRTEVRDRHRDEVAARLRSAGLSVQTDVGLSDFRVDLTLAHHDAPAEPVVAVLLDGPGWASRRTVGDRDGLPVEVLGQLMGWPAVERVWMPAWLADPAAVVQTLAAVVEQARHAPQPSRGATQSTAARELPSAPKVAQVELPREAAAVQPPASSASAVLPGESVFSPFPVSHVGGRHLLDDLPARHAVGPIRSVLESVVRHEGPVHLERLARLTAACFDLSRLNQARIDTLVKLVPRELLPDQHEGFAWPTGMNPLTWTEFRGPGGSDPRPMEHIALREIGNAMVALCATSAGMSAAELATETLVVFGWKRRTTGILGRLDAALVLAVAQDRLRANNVGVYHPV